MALQFGADSIHGTHEDLKPSPWARQSQRTSVFGLKGAVELTGQRTTRQIIAPYWIYNNYATAANLETYLSSIEAWAEEPDRTLTESGSISRTFEHCKFERLERLGDILPSPQIGWWLECLLIWDQLSPNTPVEA